MFATIEGTITYRDETFAIVENAGIGYKVFLTSYALGKTALIERVRLHVYTYVREDSLALYGFLERGELKMFELLLSVSGIGPKAALGILAIADPKTIRAAIIQKDPSVLTRVSGIGKKTAERVILDLGNKIEDLPEQETQSVLGDNEVLDALTAMGYSIYEAREAVKRIPQTITDTGEKIKYALKNIIRK